MQEEIIKIDELAKITNMKITTLREYLAGYRFNKFMIYIMENARKRLAYKVNPSFANEMARTLYLRRKWNELKFWTKYCATNDLSILSEEYENV